MGRLPRDIKVNPAAPDPLPLDRPISRSETQNARLRQDITELRAVGAEEIRVNQQQVNLHGIRVGVNRPDLQYAIDGQRHYVEYDTTKSTRGPGHASRIMANDPSGHVTLVTQN